MPLSLYLRTLPHPEKPGWTAVFSTRKASLCLLPDATLARLAEGDVPEALDERLRDLAVTVPDLATEREEVLGFVDEVNRADRGLTLAVILGMACNFACPYCYEGDLKGNQRMSGETADRLIAFVREGFGPEKRQLLLDFYGGETLLYVPLIQRIAGQLRPFTDEKDARFRFTLVTNGSLLTPAVVKDLLPLGLSNVRVTLDGPAEIHDRNRPFRSGKGSFETILANVKACADLVKISVGGNYTAENWRLFPRLLDRLEAEGLTPERLGLVQFAPVNQANDRHALPEYRGGCASMSEPWLVEAGLTLREEVLRRGYRAQKISPAPCMVDLGNALTVNWDGALCKCPALIGRPEFAVGDLWKGPRDYRETYRVQQWKDDPECRKCTYLPLCLGGCRHMRYQREGQIGVECQKTYLDAALGPMILQDLKYRHRA